MAAPSRKQPKFCFAILFAVIGLVILVVILGFTVFKPKRPTIAVESISLRDLAVALDPTRLAVDLNLTLMVDAAVRNPNKVAFRYSDSTAVVSYRGEEVGEAPIPAGRLSADGTERMNLLLTMMADRLLAKSELFSDVVAGKLPISTYVRLSGKVTIIGVFKIHVVASSACDFAVDIKNRSIGDQECRYRTQL